MSFRQLCGRLFANTERPVGARRAGFTLVELLIVISIIAVLTSLVVGGLAVAKRKQEDTEAKSTVSSIRQSLDQYVLDEGQYPAGRKEPDPERNDFPDLWRALMDRDNPYLASINRDNILVLEGDEYRTALREEIDDPTIDKYLSDPWGNPYVYRCNKYHEKREWMRDPTGVDVYSWGRNLEDDTVYGTEDEDNDDVH